jgi:hypothetical protein
MRDPQVLSQGGYGISGGIGDDGHFLPLINMLAYKISGFGVNPMADHIFEPFLAELNEFSFPDSRYRLQRIPIGFLHIQEVVPVSEVIDHRFKNPPSRGLSPAQGIAHKGNPRVAIDQGPVHIEKTDLICGMIDHNQKR